MNTFHAVHAQRHVLGYSGTQICSKSRSVLNDWRNENLVLDLRIERALISAAVVRFIQCPDVRHATTRAFAGSELQSDSHSFSRALIKADVKSLLLNWIQANLGKSAPPEQLMGELIGACLLTLVTNPLFQAAWVAEVSSLVGWEVLNAYEHKRRRPNKHSQEGRHELHHTPGISHPTSLSFSGVIHVA